MALTQITYNDKSNYQSSSLANEYKVSASDMNEIKTVVNDAVALLDSSSSFSTSEKVIGTWVNNKPLYRKVIDTGTLPNATSKTVSTGLSGVKVRHMYGTAIHPNGTTLLLPYVATTIGAFISVTYNSSNQIVIDASSTDRSGYTTSYMVIEYTKDSD